MLIVATTAPNINNPAHIDPATQNWLNKTVTCKRWQLAGTIAAVAIGILLVAPPIAVTGFCVYMAVTVTMTAFKVRFAAIAISALIHAAIGIAPPIFLYVEASKNNYHNPTIAHSIVENLRNAPLHNVFARMSPKEHAKFGFLPDDKVPEIEAMLQRHNTLQAQYRQQLVASNVDIAHLDVARATLTELNKVKANWITWRKESLIDKQLLPTPQAILRA